MVADMVDYVVGVDTHLDEHVVAVVAAPSGAVLARESVQANGARLRSGAAVRGGGCRRCLRLGERRRARDTARLAQPRPPHPPAPAQPQRPSSNTRILEHVHALAPRLLDEPGVGPIVAAQPIVAWSHHGRVHSEAAFARLAGPDPGLQRPDDPAQAQPRRRPAIQPRPPRALHTIVLHRRQHDPTTKDHIAQRIGEGKTRRDATRLLKRYLARHLYRRLQQEPQTT